MVPPWHIYKRARVHAWRESVVWRGRKRSRGIKPRARRKRLYDACKSPRVHTPAYYRDTHSRETAAAGKHVSTPLSRLHPRAHLRSLSLSANASDSLYLSPPNRPHPCLSFNSNLHFTPACECGCVAPARGKTGETEGERKVEGWMCRDMRTPRTGLQARNRGQRHEFV